MSSANRTFVGFVEESTFGVMPVANLQELRHTGETFKQEQDTTQSNELRSDRMVADIIRTAVSAAGDIKFELSFATFDEFFKGALFSSAFSAAHTNTNTTIDMAAGDNSVNDSANAFTVANGYAVGKWIRTSGFTNPANNGYFKIVTRADGKLTLKGGTVVTEAAGASRTVKLGQRIVNGTTKRSYAIERQYLDLSNEFTLYTGMTISKMDLSVAAGEIVTGSFTFVGKVEGDFASSQGTGNTAANSNEIMNAMDNIVEILENYSLLAVQECTFSVENNLEARKEIGSVFAPSIKEGSVSITGTLKKYFNGNSFSDKFRDNTASAISIVFKDSVNNAYVLDFPRIKYSASQAPATAKNDDVFDDASWEAMRDGTEGIMMSITKF